MLRLLRLLHEGVEDKNPSARGEVVKDTLNAASISKPQLMRTWKDARHWRQVADVPVHHPKQRDNSRLVCGDRILVAHATKACGVGASLTAEILSWIARSPKARENVRRSS